MISAATLRGMPEFITAELGPRALLRAYDLTGLPVGVMDIENAYIPETALLGFIDQAAREAGESHIGLHLAPYLSVQSYGPWGRYVLETTTLGGCLTRCANAIDLHASYRSWNTSVEGDRAWLRYKFPSAGRQGYGNLAICGVGVLINIIRSYVGPDWQPDVIELDVTRPTMLTEFHDTFPCEIRFAANSIGVGFHSDLLDRRSFQSAECGITTLTDVRRSRANFVPMELTDVIAEIIRVQIYKGHVDMDAAARSLDIGVRRRGRSTATGHRIARLPSAGALGWRRNSSLKRRCRFPSSAPMLAMRTRRFFRAPSFDTSASRPPLIEAGPEASKRALSEQNAKYLERPSNRSDRPGEMQENQWPRNPVLTFWQSKRICSDNAPLQSI
jgi:hypothetical protein